MARLALRLLGPFQASLDGVPLSGFASDKVRALLAYLASSPDKPHRRETLAGLLWPEFPERSARNSLRNALANLRRVLGEQGYRRDPGVRYPFLASNRRTIRFESEGDYCLDTVAFRDLLASAPPSSDQLERALSLHRGLFLEGFSLPDAAPFEEWLLLQREHFGRQLVEGLDALAAIYEAEGAYESALAHARRRVELEPWQESGQRRLMRLLSRSGQPNQALAALESLQESLRAELGTEPSAETRALGDAIRSGEVALEPVSRAGQPVPNWNLPTPATPFFGRADELAALEAKLADPDTRLLTVTGLGGCGKTRLALEMGLRLVERDRQAQAGGSPLTMSHGIVFVPLAAVDSVESLVPALADALQLRLERGEEQLLQFLRRKEFLLILDNLEQLLAGVGLLAEMLSIAPGVRILATSRERLQMQGEHVIQLGGLPFPEEDRLPGLESGGEMEHFLAAHPAMHLLAEGVQRVRSDFSLGAGDLPTMREICRLVDGLPLALELAASWADALSLESILAEARRSLDFWQVDWSDLPERQRSIRAVFAVSWRRLSPAERAMFSSLTVFRGGFTREAAGHVVAGAEAILQLLAALGRKSFLRFDEIRDRYGIHELLRQYGAEKLNRDPVLAATSRERHSAYYLDRMPAWQTDLIGSRQHEALSEMEIESENIRHAWHWAVEQAQFERLDGAMEGMYHFHWYGGRYLQGAMALQAAVKSAAEAASTSCSHTEKATCLRVWLRALAWQSSLRRALGQQDGARCLQQQCLAILQDPAVRDLDFRLERAILALCAGFTTSSVDFQLARGHFGESFGLFRELDLQWGMAWATINSGNMSAILGHYDDARQQLEEGLGIWRSLGNQSGISYSLGFLAYLARMEGRFEEAVLLAREAYEVTLEQGIRSRGGMNCLFYAVALEHLGEFAEARALAQEGLALAEERGNQVRYAQAHSTLPRVEMHQGRYEEARAHCETGLALSQAHGPRFAVGLSHLLLGCLDLVCGAYASALQHTLDSIAVFEEYGPIDDLSWGFTALSLATLGLGRVDEACRYLLHAFQIADDVGTIPPVVWALPAAALLLVDKGRHQRAIEVRAQAWDYPFVAKSRWFADVAGDKLAAVAAALPAERVAELEERGRACDLDTAVAELVAVFCG